MTGRRSGELPSLREVLPDARFGEYHERELDASLEVAGRAVRSITLREVRVAAPLMAVRLMPALLAGHGTVRMDRDEPLFVVMSRGYFEQVGISPYGYVLVSIGQPQKILGGERHRVGLIDSFTEFSDPGFCKIVTDLRARERGGRTVVSTETLITCTDDTTRRAFGRYWFGIRPFSGLIRRSMLAAVHRRTSG